MDKRCIECLINAPKKQELIDNLESSILKADQIIYNDSLIMIEKDRHAAALTLEIAELNKSVKRQKVFKWLGSGLGIIGTVFFALKP